MIGECIMMRIAVFSDTHGDIKRCIHIIDSIKPDIVIHAGDCENDARALISMYPDLKFYCVCGNNDFSRTFPPQVVFEADGKKIFVTHGHEYKVKYESTYTTLYEKAKEFNADLCVFGHTHIPYSDFREGMRILNPGSIRYGGTYGVCEIENGRLKTCILEI